MLLNTLIQCIDFFKVFDDLCLGTISLLVFQSNCMGELIKINGYIMELYQTLLYFFEWINDQIKRTINIHVMLLSLKKTINTKRIHMHNKFISDL